MWYFFLFFSYSSNFDCVAFIFLLALFSLPFIFFIFSVTYDLSAFGCVCVCMRERERKCVCVCEREREFVCVFCERMLLVIGSQSHHNVLGFSRRNILYCKCIFILSFFTRFWIQFYRIILDLKVLE